MCCVVACFVSAAARAKSGLFNSAAQTTMSGVLRHISSALTFLRLPVAAPPLCPSAAQGAGEAMAPAYRLGWSRGIRVRVQNGNLEQALAVMERKMRSSGMERLIRRRVDHHLKNSEKRVLARKNLEMRVRSQELARKLRTILVKKIRGL